MNGKNIVIFLAIIAVAVGGYLLIAPPDDMQAPLADNEDGLEEESGDVLDVEMGEVQEFEILSYYDPEAERPFFSVEEITVHQGDRVRLRVTNTFGMHDFMLPEYEIFEATPLDEEVVIEFTADQAGEFVYYCSMPGHREAGQWGTLRVLSAE